jgi:hypothetical protein
MDCMSCTRSSPTFKSSPVTGAQVLHHETGIFRLRIEAGPDSGPADAERSKPISGLSQLFPMAKHRAAVGGEFLSQPDRSRVLEMGPARLDHSIELVALLEQGVSQRVERSEKAGQRGQGRQPHGGWNDVVGALRHVDVIVGVHRAVAASGLTQDLVRAVRQDFVAVHVVAGARAGLIDVHDELITVLAAQHLIGGLDDGVGEFGLEAVRSPCGSALLIA